MAAGFALLAVAFAVAAAAVALQLMAGENAASTGTDVATMVSMVGIAAAFGLAARSMRGIRENRDARVARAAWLAAGAFAIGCAAVTYFAVGLGIFAAGLHGSGVSDTGLAVVWLVAASGAGTAAGSACFVVALRRSRRAGAAAGVS